ELFLDANDASFRLLDTWIMIGRKPFLVAEVRPEGYNPRVMTKILGCFWDKAYEGLAPSQEFWLERLSVLTMFACPRGYYRDTWISRGPSRNRFQGIKRSALWGLTRHSEYVPAPEIPIGELLYGLANQPKIYTGQA